MFGHRFLVRVVWKLLFKTPCLNNIFWNHLEANFKQQTLVSSGTSVIKLNTLMGPTWLAFLNVCLLSLLSSLHAPNPLYLVRRSHSNEQPRTLTHLHNSPHPMPFHFHNSPHQSNAINPNRPIINASSTHIASPT